MERKSFLSKNNFLVMFLLLIFLAGITSPLYAFKLNISKAEMTLEVGQQDDFYVQGFSGTGWLEYKSSNSGVSQVEQSQSNAAYFDIKALSPGQATITITATDQMSGEEAKAVCVVTVVDKAAVKIESVTLVPSVLNLEVGEEMQLNVKITPADANPGDVVLGYYDTKIIEISSDAVVKGKALGQTEIIAHTRDKSIEARAEVYVGSDIDKIGIVLDNVWTKFKEFLRGESFAVQVPSATCGVRG